MSEDMKKKAIEAAQMYLDGVFFTFEEAGAYVDPIHPWSKQRMGYYIRAEKNREKSTRCSISEIDIEISQNKSNPPPNKGGRPTKKETDKTNQLKITRSIALIECSELWAAELKKHKLYRRSQSEVMSDIRVKYDVSLCASSVSQHAHALLKGQKIRVGVHGPPPLLANLEPIMAETLRQCAGIGFPIQCASVGEFIAQFVKGTEYDGVFSKNSPPDLPSIKLVHSFLTRWSHLISPEYCSREPIDRLTWATYGNMKRWFQFLEERFIQAGIARHEMSSDQVQQLSLVIFKPERLFNTDETPLSLCMKKDGHGIAKVVASVQDSTLVVIEQSQDRVTLIPGCLATGEPTPCVIVWQSEASEPQVREDWVLGSDGHGGPQVRCNGKMWPTSHYANGMNILHL
jgi:hypothetical protein